MPPRRLFVAIPLPAPTRDALYAAAEAMRHSAPDLRWTPPDRLHLTVKFLGDTGESLLEPLATAIRDVAGAHASVPLVVRGAGAFPTLRRARVVWAGVEPATRLELLQHDLEVALDALGIPVEGRAFRPHVTLARVKSPLDPDTARALARAVRRFDFESGDPVSSLDLMQSSLTQQGSTYRCLISAPLRAG